jgi:D-alanyl-D-alanine carboxypeptidase
MANSTTTRAIRGSFTVWGWFSLFFAGLALLAPPAIAAKPTTWIVIDAATGQILSQDNPDALNYPASLTKMMTLFLTFDALEHHRISLDQQFTVTRHASVQQPSKLGLRPGTTIAVRDLILAVVTHSANDAAVVLAENLAGSEPAFAIRMNAEARALGMTRTNFRNASGLPDRFQYTTARDLSKLALALYRTFPKEYAYFATENFTYNGETYGNHNHLMEAFEGMDGIKTGFINASGFNLAASAVRNNRRLIGVIMGGRTAQSRDMEMAELLDDAFAHRGTAAPVAVASNDVPDRTPLHFRNGDGLSAISSVLAAMPPANAAPAPAPAHRNHVYRTASLSRRHDRHHEQTAARHHKLRHGVVLASLEFRSQAGERHHFERHSSARRHHQRHFVAAQHHYAGKHQRRFAALSRHGRHAVSVSASRSLHRSHGVACGGWNGSTRPCPAELRRARRPDVLRSASIAVVRTGSPS